MTKPLKFVSKSSPCACGCGETVTTTIDHQHITYVDHSHWPSYNCRNPPLTVPKIKVCTCGCGREFEDYTGAQIRKYFKPKCGRIARIKTTDDTPEWSPLGGEGKDKPYRTTVCLGRGLDGKGVSTGPCANTSKCSDSLCDGRDGLYTHDKNGGLDCYERPAEKKRSLMGCALASCQVDSL